jgi:hypothetical protein
VKLLNCFIRIILGFVVIQRQLYLVAPQNLSIHGQVLVVKMRQSGNAMILIGKFLRSWCGGLQLCG